MYLFSIERIKTYMFVLTLKCRLINSLTACVSLTFCSMIKFVNLFIQSFFTRNHFCGVQFCSGKIYFNVFVIHLEFCMYNLHNSYWFWFSLKFGLLCLMFWKVLCVFVIIVQPLAKGRLYWYCTRFKVWWFRNPTAWTHPDLFVF